MSVIVEGQKINITHPEKVLWPALNIRKVDYLNILIELADFILPHTIDCYLTTIRFPHGVGDKFFYQKKINKTMPKWIEGIKKEEDSYINLNKLSTLIWLGNSAALEFHTTFTRYTDNYISKLVFDLDPSEGQNFDNVAEAALIINEELKKLNIISYPKTSGSTGIQIYIPLEKKYTYEEGRIINKFFAEFFIEKYPNIFTIERNKKNRKNLLYFDYLQMWKGKSIISVYSPRAVESAAVSTPVTWNEIDKGIKPSDFNLNNIVDRLKNKGDLFKIFLTGEIEQNFDFILSNIK